MASSAWLPVEVQSSTSQNPATGLLVGEPSEGPRTPTAATTPASVATTPTSEGVSGASSNSVQESAQGKFVNVSPHLAPGPSFSYAGIPHATTASGISQQLPSGSVSTTSCYCYFYYYCYYFLMDGFHMYLSDHKNFICILEFYVLLIISNAGNKLKSTSIYSGFSTSSSWSLFIFWSLVLIQCCK